MGEGSDETRRRSVQEAADELGVSVDAIRSRIKRNTIPHIRRSGRVWVLLGGDQGNRPGQGQSESSTLMSEMRDRIRFLEEEMQRKDAILLNMTEAMRALNAPERESPVSAEEGPEGAGPRPGAEGTQEAVQRPWWRRMFGG